MIKIKMIRKVNRERYSQVEACQSKSMAAQAQITVPPAICTATVVEPFDDGWPEHKKTLFDVLT
jgi:hypothetical protein